MNTGKPLTKDICNTEWSNFQKEQKSSSHLITDDYEKVMAFAGCSDWLVVVITLVFEIKENGRKA